MITTLIATGIVGGGSDHPLLGEFRLRYPEFASVSDQLVVYWMSKAVATVTECWGTDYEDGIMLFAAHKVSISGALTVGPGRGELAGVTRFRSASMDIAISETVANAGAKGGWSASSYGQEFQILLRRHCGGPRLVGCVEPRGYPC
jgi:hypothetical protein